MKAYDQEPVTLHKKQYVSLNSREAGIAGNRKEPVSASVAMVHNIPELIISEKVDLKRQISFFKAIANMSTQDYSVFLLSDALSILCQFETCLF